MDELLENFITASRSVWRREEETKPEEPDPRPIVVARWPKKKLSLEGRRMLAAAVTQNATLTQIE